MEKKGYSYDLILNDNFDSFSSKYRVIAKFQGKVIGRSFANTKWGALFTARAMMKKHYRYQRASDQQRLSSRHYLS